MEYSFIYSILNIFDACVDFFSAALIQLDAPSAWGIYFQDSATPAKRFRKSLKWVQLLNSRYVLKFLVPNYNLKVISGWINYSCMVISQKMIGREMVYHGSKSTNSFIMNAVVKEQRVNSSWYKIRSLLRWAIVFKMYSNEFRNKLSNQNPFLQICK